MKRRFNLSQKIALTGRTYNLWACPEKVGATKDTQILDTTQFREKGRGREKYPVFSISLINFYLYLPLS